MKLMRSTPLLIVCLVLASCSAQPLPPKNSVPKATHPNADPVDLQSATVSQERRTPTMIRFETSDRFPEFRFNNGGDHPQGSILETLGGGVAMLDFDRDGRPDICLAGGGGFLPDSSRIVGTSVGLLRNQIESQSDWIDVGRHAGLVESELFSLGVAAADFDNDGFPDLCVTGYGPTRLYQNQGDGTFTECGAERALKDSGFVTSAAWGDLNRDGHLDLYLCHYVSWSLTAERDCHRQKPKSSDICGPKSFPAESDHVFYSLGDGQFTDMSINSGLQAGGKGLGVVIGDVDLDGDVDVYVANDTTANFLYLNQGDGRLEEAGALHGVAYDDNGRPTGSMGVALADYDGDGLPDLWTTNFEYEALALYRNMGHAQFHSVSRPAGVTALYGEYVSWGTAFGDFDDDGDLDVVVANGHLPRYVPQDHLAQRPFLLQNEDCRRFSLAQSPENSYFSTPHTGRGLALADSDGDGRLDVVVSHLSEPASILRNTTNSGGTSLRVTLVGRNSNRDAIGATAVLESSIGSRLQQLVGGSSYLSTSELIMHWGLPAEATLKKLSIVWPSGKVQVIDFAGQSQEKKVIHLRIVEP